jgi:hypothetical protein
MASRNATVTVTTNSSAGPLSLDLLPPTGNPDSNADRNWQFPAFAACLRHFGRRHRWMGARGGCVQLSCLVRASAGN